MTGYHMLYRMKIIGLRFRKILSEAFAGFGFVMPAIVPASILFCCNSCMEEDSASLYPVRKLEVSGYVFDKNTQRPLKDIMISLSSYDEKDVGMKFPISNDTVYTSSKGAYIVSSISLPEMSFFGVSAADTVVNRAGGRYATMTNKMYIDFSGQSFDEETGTAYVYNCDFYLEQGK